MVAQNERLKAEQAQEMLRLTTAHAEAITEMKSVRAQEMTEIYRAHAMEVTRLHQAHMEALGKQALAFADSRIPFLPKERRANPKE